MSSGICCRNTVEIRAVGLQRAGNHAVLNWISNQVPGSRKVFLNNVAHGNLDPFLTAEGVETKGFDPEISTPELQEASKDLLMYSYEDDSGKMGGNRSILNVLTDPEFEESRTRFLGTSARRFDYLILRDPFNFFASRIRKLNELPGVRDLDTIVAEWKTMARSSQALGSEGSDDRHWVSFNAWFASKAYRQRIAKGLGGRLDDHSMREVKNYGGGSSFEGNAKSSLSRPQLLKRWRSVLRVRNLRKYPQYLRTFFGGGARSMDVAGRWKLMSGDPLFRSVFRDVELLELSEALFGEIEGTREFVKSLSSR